MAKETLRRSIALALAVLFVGCAAFYAAPTQAQANGQTIQLPAMERLQRRDEPVDPDAEEEIPENFLSIGGIEAKGESAKGNGWVYKNGVLTLNNCSDKKVPANDRGIISTKANLTVNLQGSNEIAGVFVFGNMTIKGNGTLNLSLETGDEGIYEVIFVMGDLNIKGGTINFKKRGSEGVLADRFTMTGGTLNMPNGSAGINALDVQISGGIIKIRASYEGICGWDVRVKGKPNIDVVAKGADGEPGYGIVGFYSVGIDLTGGKVHAQGKAKRLGDMGNNNLTGGGGIVAGEKKQSDKKGKLTLGARNEEKNGNTVIAAKKD
jgi:hypothetical protein